MLISLKERFAYFCYGTGQCISFGLAGSFTMIFYTDIFGISAATASIIFLIARAWDALIDPLVAGLMDTFHSKHGKFKIYLKYTPFLVAFSTILCFTKFDLHDTTKIIYAAGTYMLWGTFYAMSDVPFWSMSAVMTSNPLERSKLVSYAGLAVSIGIAIPLFVMPLMINYFGKGNLENGYLYSTAILMLIALVLMNFGYRNTKERVQHNESKISLIDVFKTILANKPLFLILLAFFTNLFTNVASAIAVYFFTYNMQNVEYLSMYGVINIFCALGLIGVPFLLDIISKKKLIFLLCYADIVLRLIFFFFIGYGNTISFFIFIALTGIIYAITWPLLSAMIVDTIDYAAQKTGNRCEAIMFAGQTFTGKLAIAVSGGVTGLVLIIIGYSANHQQTSFALNGLFFSLALLPALGSLLKIIILKFYNYDSI